MQQGMTLRDYFAAKALPAVLSQHPHFMNPKVIAGAVYELADAMRKARDVGKP